MMAPLNNSMLSSLDACMTKKSLPPAGGRWRAAARRLRGIKRLAMILSTCRFAFLLLKRLNPAQHLGLAHITRVGKHLARQHRAVAVIQAHKGAVVPEQGLDALQRGAVGAFLLGGAQRFEQVIHFSGFIAHVVAVVARNQQVTGIGGKINVEGG